MDAGVHVRLLGRAGAQAGDTAVDFLPNRRYQLLAYLAYQGDWVGRDRLAFLFWPDEIDHTARHNLRQLLKHVRKLTWLEGLEANEYQLRWMVQTDIALFKQAMAQRQIEATLPLYRGVLLDGLEGNGEGEFGEWLAMERESLHSRWREALLLKTSELIHDTANEQAATLVHHLLERDPLDEEALQAYMTTAAAAGQRMQALAAHGAFAKRLQAELGMSPSSKTEQLVEAFAHAPSVSPPLPPPLPRESASEPELLPSTSLSLSLPSSEAPTSAIPQLPRPASSFVGRDLELGEIAQLLSGDDCRLLTLTGAGGTGKTRLALQAAQELSGSYPGSTYFVALEALGSPEMIPSAIAGALGLELLGHDEPIVQLVRFLKPKRVLMVLDNYEHLLVGANLVSELLRACPDLRLLVTSRERLDLEEEWLLPVEGLSYPVGAATLDEALLSYDAVRLFTERARRVRPSYDLTDDELPHVVKVCQLVEGLPLGIELAAAWMRALAAAEIADEIGKNYDFLSSQSRNTTARHRSIQATFEYSWRLLSPKEQEVLRKLSVFRGGFRKEAAAYVADAGVAVLAALVDKSLLSRSAKGRFNLHPLIYHYTREKLNEHPQEISELGAKHNTYFLNLMQQWHIHIHINDYASVQYLFENETDNICAAWEWLVLTSDLPGIRANVLWLAVYLGISLQLSRAVSLINLAFKVLRDDDPSHRSVICRVTSSLTYAHYFLGNREQAAEFANITIRLLQCPKDNLDRHSRWAALIRIADIYNDQGDWKHAQESYTAAMVEAQQLRDISDGGPPSIYVRDIKSGMAQTALFQGDYAKAEELYDEIGINSINDSDILDGYGDLLAVVNRLEESISIYLKAIKLAREIGHTAVMAICLAKVALHSASSVSTEATEAYLQDALSTTDRLIHVSNKADVSQALINIGRTFTALGNYKEARKHLREGIKFAWELKAIPLVKHALVAFVELEIAQQRFENARYFLGSTLGADRIKQETKDLRDVLAAKLNLRGDSRSEGVFPPEDYEEAYKKLEKFVNRAMA